MLSTSEARRMNVSDLRAELEGRGLNSSGTKPQILARLLLSIQDTSSSAAREPRSPSATPSSRQEHEQEQEQDLESAAAASPTPQIPVRSSNDDLRQFVRQEVHSAVTVALSEAIAPMLATITAPGSAGTQPSAESSNAGNLSVPQTIREKILKGDFVDFTQLLPDTIATSYSAPRQLQLQFSSGGQSLEVVEGGAAQPVRRRVHDLPTWLEAWTLFMNVVCSANPSRLQEMLSYQGTIVAANRQYYPEAWLSYDTQFRSAISAQPGKRFDVIDINLWQMSVTSRSRPTCESCRLIHPGGGQCPFRPQRNNQQACNGVRTVSNGQPIYRNFNAGRCSLSTCKYAHVCNCCGSKDHNGSKCGRRQ